MNDPRALEPQRLCWRCEPSLLEFETTDDLPDLDAILGQDRALDAVQFGIQIRKTGYNLWALGPPGIGKRTIVQDFLEQRSASEPVPSDWCYIHNFEDPHRPKALELPPGRANDLRQHMEHLIEDLHTAIPAALEAEEHQNRVQEVEHQAKRVHDTALNELAQDAAKRGIQLVRTASGFAVAPLRDGEVLSPEEFEKLPDQVRNGYEEALAEVQDEMRDFAEKIPQWRREAREKIKQLNQAATGFVVKHSLAHLKRLYADFPEVIAYFESVEGDVIESAEDFCPKEEESQLPFKMALAEEQSFRRYRVNVLVDNANTDGAPVVYEDHPVYHNLLGRVEHRAQMGTLLTDFTLIQSGALHRANGGYLVLDAMRMLQQPYAWEGLKRALHSHAVRIETMAESLSLQSTVSLHPQPIPLDVKVVLLGDRMLYYMLYQSDRDFAELFKVAADFSDRMERTPDNCQMYARVIATLARRQENRPLHVSAVARVLEESARLADDSERLTTHMRTIADLLQEADYWASQDESDIVQKKHVDLAIDKQIYRADRMRERIQEEIERGSLMIDTDGEQVAQVNGLSVIDLGNFAFGRPSRITATARLGRGNVVDIEREVDLGGSLHSKGVLIITSFLAARYAKDHPLSLHSSLVFEQSYGMVDGDSASVAELCALMSALSEVPIKQSFAVTGSVNQLGQVQPIGGVNQKIEGYFDVCRRRGLTGQQGVLIPETNVKNLMLRSDVVEAAANDQFHIYSVRTIDEAVSLLTGLPAGEKDGRGEYPKGSVNHLVEARLKALYELRRKMGTDQSPQKSVDQPESGNHEED